MNRLNNTILSAAALGLLALLSASCIKTIPVSGLSVSQTSLTLVEGEEAHLTVTVTPADATDPSVIWRSSDPAVATVNDGLVHAVAPGTATITVSTPDGQQTASCAVTVNR
nr:Ig-like domain-containing protein [Bacteroidales bacterium]